MLFFGLSLSSSCFQQSFLDHNKIQISDNFWILQNMVPHLIDTDKCPLWMFPVLFLLYFCLLNFIRSNTFGIAFKKSRQIKLLSADVDTVQYFFCKSSQHICNNICTTLLIHLNILYYALTYMQ